MTLSFVPVPMPESRPFWDGAAEGRLTLPYCSSCEKFFFYPRGFCPSCHASPVRWRSVSGRGRVASYVISQRPVPGAPQRPPFVIALVELDEGPRMMSTLVEVAADPRYVHLDQRVEVHFEQRGEISLPVFRPVSGSAE